MKKIPLLFSGLLLLACNKPETTITVPKNNSVVWSTDAETIYTYNTAMNPSTGQMNMNIDEWFRRITVLQTIQQGLTAGKLKAYKNYPNNPISAEELKNVKHTSIARIRFHEKIEMDTINFSLTKKISLLTLDIDSISEKDGRVVGVKKWCDVKLNE